MKARAVIVLLGLAALLTVAVVLDGGSLREALRYTTEHPLQLLVALAAYTGAFVLRAFAWRPLVAHRIPTSRLFGLIMAALFLNHVAPAKAGDFARMYGLAKRGIGGGRAVASVLLARLADLVGLLAVLAGSWALVGGVEWASVAVPAGVVGVAALVLWTLARVETLPPLGRLTEPVAKVRDALRETRPDALGVALLCAAPAWVLEAGILLFVARSLGLELSVAEAVTATCFAVLMQAVPLTPGGLATYEAGMVFVLIGFGVPPGPAFTAAVVSHAMKFVYALGAVPFAVYEGVSAAGARSSLPTRKVENNAARLEV